MKKGSKVYLEGQLQTREFTDKEGNQRKTTEVVLQRFRGELTLLDSRGRGDADADRGGFEDSSSSFGRSSPMERDPRSSARRRLGRPHRRHHRRRHPILAQGSHRGDGRKREPRSGRRRTVLRYSREFMAPGGA